MTTTGLRLYSYFGESALVVRLVGRLTGAGYPDLRDELFKLAAQEPRAMVLDLDAMDVMGTAPLTVFPLVWARISDWPGVPLLLVAAREPLRALLAGNAVSRFVPTYRSMAEALGTLEDPPPRRRRRLLLGNKPDAARRARRTVEQVCLEWEIPEVSADAVLVVSELTENVVRHARSEGWLCLELRGHLFTVAVADSDPRPPRPCPPDERRHGGRGLTLVAELSRAWGYAPQLQQGKVVWAVLPVPGR